jgi:TrmH family RNA methyltransferase
LTSRDNPRIKRWTKLAQDARYRRAEKRALVEGPHLLAAALQHGHRPVALLATEEGIADEEISRLIGESGLRPTIVAASLFRRIVDAENPPGVAAEIAIPEPDKKDALQTVFLEGVQDPSNVGAIVRSAAAFGVGRVVLDRGCADPWSPKALRAGMGGHFSLALQHVEKLATEMTGFKGKLICTVPTGAVPIQEADLTGNLGWVFGGEGKGLSEESVRRAALRITIPMAAGTESLNVAAAAAICLYEAFKTATPRSPSARDPLVRGSSQ